ncbi:Holliday junction branch migration protein RuvA [Patescibacteria group bacterium]
MIIQLEGTIKFRTERFVVVDVNGVGYRVFVSFETLKEVSKQEKVTFWTHLHVRENILDIYGFLNYSELDFFELLIGISGIGPKGAIAVLSVAPIDLLKKAISTGETSYLTKVSGIGRRLAEKIVVELKDKFGALEKAGDGESLKDEEESLEALQSLGYSLREGREAIRKIPDGTTGTENIVKEALRNINKK